MTRVKYVFFGEKLYRIIENGRKLAAACAGSPQTDGPVRRLPYKIFGVEKEKGGPGSGRGAKIPARSPEGLLDSSARYS